MLLEILFYPLLLEITFLNQMTTKSWQHWICSAHDFGKYRLINRFALVRLTRIDRRRLKEGGKDLELRSYYNLVCPMLFNLSNNDFFWHDLFIFITLLYIAPSHFWWDGQLYKWYIWNYKEINYFCMISKA